jgi:hypothetical protein
VVQDIKQRPGVQDIKSCEKSSPVELQQLRHPTHFILILILLMIRPIASS